MAGNIISRLTWVTNSREIPNYVVGRHLGGGPTCDVYRATDHRGRTVAVKVLKSKCENDPLAVMLIRREARAGLAISHQHLVQFHDSHVARPPYFVVMENLIGETTKERFLKHNAFPVSLVLGIARQVAEGLSVLHRAGFIHGDVKPANVFLTSPGKAKLIDLGFTHKPGELKPWAEKGHVIGTANYLAPEIAVLPPEDDYASDLFSLGVMIFELLTGRLPYPGRSTGEVVRKRRTCEPAQLPAGIWPKGLSELILRLTNPKPNLRPSAKQIISELAAYQIAALGRKAG